MVVIVSYGKSSIECSKHIFLFMLSLLSFVRSVVGVVVVVVAAAGVMDLAVVERTRVSHRLSSRFGVSVIVL